jgi:exodeoxyribonuclease VII large subunit
MFEQPSLFGPKVLTVSGISQYLRALMESDEILQDVWISGEISTFSQPKSGHIYFTLKDNAASLRCVIWRNAAQRLAVRLQTGMAVEVHGYISVYEAGGQYQIYVDTVRLAGEGLLYQEFMRLKARLEADGLFDEERKRDWPAYPKKIGMITSPTGAALQDMLNTLKGRYPLAEVWLAPAIVQGDTAPPTIVAALSLLNQIEDMDVILLARGGGSLEDLWAFNDERVVRAVAASRIPVITGVGHETDFTLVDFASDYRAPTPTAAAVAAVPDAADLKRNVEGLSLLLNKIFTDKTWQCQQALTVVNNRFALVSPLRRIQNDQQRLDEFEMRLERSYIHTVSLQQSRLEGLTQRLEALNPKGVMRRGYALVRDAAGNVLRSVDGVTPGTLIQVEVADGEMAATVNTIQKNQETK